MANKDAENQTPVEIEAENQVIKGKDFREKSQTLLWVSCD